VKGKPKTKPINLKSLGEKLAKIDRHIVVTLKKRMDLAKMVARCKIQQGKQPILRKDIEEERLRQVVVWAEEEGLNPDFAQSILYMIICESCRIQINEMQKQ